MLVAATFVCVLAAYAAAGVVFAAAFVWRGVERIDSHARGAGTGFRILIFPAAAALWPFLLRRWLRGLPDPPPERNAHRRAAGLRP